MVEFFDKNGTNGFCVYCKLKQSKPNREYLAVYQNLF